jgi:DNA-directed RNA polymerase specialized sigma24 family protein
LKSSTSEQVSAEEKTARLLALMVVREIEGNNERIRILRAAGFRVAEVASLLGITENAIAIVEHRARKAKPKNAKN